MESEFMEYDVVIVGAGPAGLAAACRLRQLNAELSVVVVEKGSEVGAHILSGAVFEPRALDELFQIGKLRGLVKTPVTTDQIYLLKDQSKATAIPSLLIPKTMHNQGNYIISLGNYAVGWQKRLKPLALIFFPASQPLTFCTRTMPWAVLSPVKWVLIEMATTRTPIHQQWNCMPSTPYLLRAAAAI